MADGTALRRQLDHHHRLTGYNPDYAKDARLLAEFKGLRSVITLIKPIRLDKLRKVLSDG